MKWKTEYLPAVLLVSLSSLLFWSCESRQERASSHYLDAATEVGEWLMAQRNDQGYIPDEVMADTTHSASLGSGAAGRALFFLELFHATGDSSYLTRAESESDAVFKLTMDAVKRGDLRMGFYNGLAGNIFTLSEMQRALRLDRYRNSLLTLIPLLEKGARKEIVNDVIVGVAGIGLVLLHLSDMEENDSLIIFASALGDTLVQRSIPAGSGIHWKRAQDMDFNLPNFSHGTAGIGYFLARLYEVTRQQAYLTRAEQAARYLMDIADREGGLFLVPYGIPNEGFATKYDIGWAHGPPGTARLFYFLWKLTGKEEYREIVAENVRSLGQSGIPGPTRDSLRWTGSFRIDQRFGTSGAATFLLKLQRAGESAGYPDLGRTIVDDLLRRSQHSEAGRYWVLPRYGFQGQRGDDAAYTGYFYGAAGLGFALLEMHYTEVNQVPGFRFPDDPFRDTRDSRSIR
jgi:hypothetical protein